jgi:hypothetical protein
VDTGHRRSTSTTRHARARAAAAAAAAAAVRAFASGRLSAGERAYNWNLRVSSSRDDHWRIASDDECSE